MGDMLQQALKKSKDEAGAILAEKNKREVQLKHLDLDVTKDKHLQRAFYVDANQT